MKKLTVDVSGFGGGYEAMCQTMLWRGVLWLAERKPPFQMWKNAKSYKGIYGVLSTAGPEFKELEAAMMRKGDGVTGAMHQAVMGHLRRIHEVGVDGWLAGYHEKAPDRIYEADVVL